MSRELVTVEGEFTADGRCAATTPRGAFAAPEDSAHAEYVIGASSNVAASGWVVHTIWCEVPTRASPAGIPMPRSLLFMISAPDGQRLGTGTYRISPDGALDTDVQTIDFSYQHPAYDYGTPGTGSGMGGNITLAGVSGELVISHIFADVVPTEDVGEVQNAQIAGRFRIRARRSWGM